MKVKLFTHTDLDGVGCSIIAKLFFGENNVDVVSTGYNNIDRKVQNFIYSKDIKNYSLILITDISVKQELAEIIDKKAKRVLLFDHHPTAMYLNKFDWCTVEPERDNEKICGTKLLYQYLVNIAKKKTNSAIHSFVEIVNKYDTWLWKEKYNDIQPKLLNDLFNLYGFQGFESNILKKLYSCINNELEVFSESEISILENNQANIDKYIKTKCDNMHRKTLFINEEYYEVGIVFAENHISELGNRMCEIYPNIDFAMIITNFETISFRTVKADIDLSQIAEYYGGGGHPKAAGAQIRNNDKIRAIDIII